MAANFQRVKSGEYVENINFNRHLMPTVAYTSRRDRQTRHQPTTHLADGAARNGHASSDALSLPLSQPLLPIPLSFVSTCPYYLAHLSSWACLWPGVAIWPQFSGVASIGPGRAKARPLIHQVGPGRARFSF